MNSYSLVIDHENGIDLISVKAGCFTDAWKKLRKHIKSYTGINKIEVRVFD